MNSWSMKMQQGRVLMEMKVFYWFSFLFLLFLNFFFFKKNLISFLFLSFWFNLFRNHLKFLIFVWLFCFDFLLLVTWGKPEEDDTLWEKNGIYLNHPPTISDHHRALNMSTFSFDIQKLLIKMNILVDELSPMGGKLPLKYWMKKDIIWMLWDINCDYKIMMCDEWSEIWDIKYWMMRDERYYLGDYNNMMRHAWWTWSTVIVGFIVRKLFHSEKKYAHVTDQSTSHHNYTSSLT